MLASTDPARAKLESVAADPPKMSLCSDWSEIPKTIPKVKIDTYVDNSQLGVNCVIYDARSKIAAFGNKVAGKGYES